MTRFVELTFMSHDKYDGKKFFVHVDDIRKIVPHEMFKESTPDLAAGEKARQGAMIKTTTDWQAIQETPEEVVAMIQDTEWTQGFEADVELLLEEDETSH